MVNNLTAYEPNDVVAETHSSALIISSKTLNTITGVGFWQNISRTGKATLTERDSVDNKQKIDLAEVLSITAK
jgi:hypothetical protein